VIKSSIEIALVTLVKERFNQNSFIHPIVVSFFRFTISLFHLPVEEQNSFDCANIRDILEMNFLLKKRFFRPESIQKLLFFF